ncbi:ATP-binding protein [Boseaceae bacterium BT-24-1]|nr:ATP-binding protein [Boseaceae bacterium BT-24-1]
MWRHGLSRQILLSMAAVTVVAALVVFVAFYVAFGFIATFFPQLINYDWLPSGTDLLILAVSILLALVAAGAIALKLAGRILVPLNSLAESARKIAGGDLTARAAPGDQSLGETAHLVDDFNTMAQRLQDMADNMRSWNAAIAHELRTPLTILRGKLQGIADGVFAADEQLIRNLLLQIEGLSRLVDDLRVVTLAHSAHLDLQKEAIDLATEIKRVLDLLAPSLKEAGFSVEHTLADITIVADGMRIRQALLALLENAQRYATPGRIEVSALIAQGKVIIRVEDDGPGLPPELTKRAFEPFTRGEPSRSRRYGGSGLGLSVVRAIAEAHGGEAIYLTSSRSGAIFELNLPLG